MMTQISLINKFSIIFSVFFDLQVKKAVSLSNEQCIPKKGDDVFPDRIVDPMEVNFSAFILLYFILFDIFII